MSLERGCESTGYLSKVKIRVVEILETGNLKELEGICSMVDDVTFPVDVRIAVYDVLRVRGVDLLAQNIGDKA